MCEVIKDDKKVKLVKFFPLGGLFNTSQQEFRYQERCIRVGPAH